MPPKKKTYEQQQRENLTKKETLIRLHKGIKSKRLNKDELIRLAIYANPQNRDSVKYNNYAKKMVKKYGL